MMAHREQQCWSTAGAFQPVTLRMCVFGSPQLWWHGVDLARSLPDKYQALLYVLGIEGRPVARATLTRLLWGDRPDEAARANLRVALSQLRRVLPGLLDIDARQVAFAEPGSGVLTDLGLLVQAAQPGASMACRLTGAHVWQGELLADFALPGCDDFDRWCAGQRAQAVGMALALLRALMRASEAAGHTDAAMDHARALLQIDGADEAAHMVLMRLLATQGERTAALRQYAACVAALSEQFGARPSASCYALYVRIHADTLPTRSEFLELGSQATGAVLTKLRVH